MRPQTHYQTCLASCLLVITDPEYTKADELACFEHMLPRSKEDFVGGHLDYVTRAHHVRIRQYIENASLFRTTPPANAKVIHEQRAITLELIERLPKPSILYVDDYVLSETVHSPHFILIHETGPEQCTIQNPRDGKRRRVPKAVIEDGVRLLREHLLFSPRLITVER